MGTRYLPIAPVPPMTRIFFIWGPFVELPGRCWALLRPCGLLYWQAISQGRAHFANIDINRLTARHGTLSAPASPMRSNPRLLLMRETGETSYKNTSKNKGASSFETNRFRFDSNSFLLFAERYVNPTLFTQPSAIAVCGA